MGIYIADNFSGVNFDVGQVQVDIISMANSDLNIGFTEVPLTVLDGAQCVEVTYPLVTIPGATSERIFDLVNSTGFASPPHIIILGDDGGFVLADGTTTAFANGFAMTPGASGEAGSSLNPFANHICVIYDITLCGGNGIEVHKEGGGITYMYTDVMLYHELSHCFHFATDTVPVDGAGNVDFPQEEVNAEMDENDMRDAKGVDRRDANSHWGQCSGAGGGGGSCCIIASLATDSPYSEEVYRLRSVRDKVLRNSLIGEAFFNRFFYEYYAFSPEITRLMGHYPELKEITRTAFVNPLLLSLDLLIYYAEQKGRNLVTFIGKQRLEKPDLDTRTIKLLNSIVAQLEESNYSEEVISNRFGEIPGFGDFDAYMNRSLSENEVIKWALFDSLKIWLKACVWIDNREEHCEERIYTAVSEWIALFPIGDTWDELSRLEVKKELVNLGNYIFDEKSKQVFSERLIRSTIHHHSDIIEWSKN
jgi:hypothetical protein